MIRKYGSSQDQGWLSVLFSLGVNCPLCGVGPQDRGCVVGEVNDEGEMTGNHVAYVYPDGQTALLGSFVDGELIEARLASLMLQENGRPHLELVDDRKSYLHHTLFSRCFYTEVK